MIDNNLVDSYLTIEDCNELVNAIKENMYLPFYGNISVEKLTNHTNVYLLKCSLDNIPINIAFGLRVGFRTDKRLLIETLSKDVISMYEFEINNMKKR